MNDMTFYERADLVSDLARMAEIAQRIETEKNGRALTPDEARIVRAVGLLRQISPDLFDDGSRCSHDDPDNSGLCIKCGKRL